MKLLVLCDQGVNRSVTLATQLKYLGHDVLSAGLQTNTRETLTLLADWADRVILTDRAQEPVIQQMPVLIQKAETWHIGPDHYPRPFNKQLLATCRSLVAEHRAGLESQDTQP